jgi:hypothetical protein
MSYFTISSMPKKATRVATYEIDYAGKSLYEATYRDTVKKGSTGRFSRYVPYSIPATSKYGHYTLRVVLQIGKASRSSTWKYSVGKQERAARSA